MDAAGTSGRTVWPLVVLVIAAIIAVIAIPNLKLARMSANEASAKRMLHAINTAQERLSASNPAEGYACTLGAMADARLIPESLASGEDKGYLFEIFDCRAGSPNGSYRAFPHPVTKKETGYWVFCTDQTARVKASPESREDCLQQGVAQR
jgi:type II secretory pathway pseudopilin PulG